MDVFLALILCHNVTPVYTSTPDQGGQDDNYDDAGQSDSDYRQKEF